jgi:hypothetical protein
MMLSMYLTFYCSNPNNERVFSFVQYLTKKSFLFCHHIFTLMMIPPHLVILIITLKYSWSMYYFNSALKIVQQSFKLITYIVTVILMLL